MTAASGDEIVRILVHDALVKGVIVVAAVVVLAVAMVVVWHVLGRPPRRDRRGPRS